MKSYYATKYGVSDYIFFKISDPFYTLKMSAPHFFKAFSWLGLNINDFKSVMNQIDFFAKAYLDGGKSSARVNEEIIKLKREVESNGLSTPESLTEVFNKWCLKQIAKEEKKIVKDLNELADFDRVLIKMKESDNEGEPVKTKARRS